MKYFFPVHDMNSKIVKIMRLVDNRSSNKIRKIEGYNFETL